MVAKLLFAFTIIMVYRLCFCDIHTYGDIKSGEKKRNLKQNISCHVK